MTTPTITLLPSGYWLVRWSKNRWVQWQRGTYPTGADTFGLVSSVDLYTAEDLSIAEEMKEEKP